MREALCHAAAVVGSSAPSLRKLETTRAAQKLLGALTTNGESARAGLVEGVKGVKYSPMQPGMYENCEKTGGFMHFLVYKSPKTLFFAQKY